MHSNIDCFELNVGYSFMLRLRQIDISFIQGIQGIQGIHGYTEYTGSTWVYRIYMGIQGIHGIHENGHSITII